MIEYIIKYILKSKFKEGIGGKFGEKKQKFSFCSR